MTGIPVTEIVGYLASLLVALAYFMKSTYKLRLVGLVGAVVFVAYGVLLTSWPLILVNLLIAVTNLYYLYILHTKKDLFEIMEIADLNSPLLHRFLRFYRDDINQWFPRFDLPAIERPKVAFIFRDLVPVGLFVCYLKGCDLVVALDYVIPGYRDFQNGEFLFNRQHYFFRKTGASRCLAQPQNGKYLKYLKKVGFEAVSDSPDGWYQRPLTLNR